MVVVTMIPVVITGRVIKWFKLAVVFVASIGRSTGLAIAIAVVAS